MIDKQIWKNTNIDEKTKIGSNINARKNINGVLAIFMVCMVMGTTGCSQVKEEHKVRITLMNGWGGATEDHVAMREIYEEFNKQNPDIELVLDTSPDLSIVLEKANEMLAVDKMPNIISTNGNAEFITYANKKGYATDLMPYIKGDKEFAACIPEQVFSNWIEDGKLYTLPDVIEMSGYWYNKEIFRKAGIEKVPETWAEFWEACDLIDSWSEQEDNGVVPVLMESSQAVFAFLGARIAGDSSTGRSLMSKQPSSFNHTLLEDALEDLIRIYHYSKATKATLTPNDSLNAFNKGKTAMYFNGAWANALIDENIETGTALYPNNNGKGVAYVSASSGYVIGNTEGEEKVEASIRFLKYMLSEEVQYKILTQTKQVPSNPNVNYANSMASVPLLTDAINTIGEAQTTINTIRTTWGDKCVNIIQDNIEHLIDEDMAPHQLLLKLEEGR